MQNKRTESRVVVCRKTSSTTSAARRGAPAAVKDKEGLPKGLKKVGKLGEGGFGVVWAAIDSSGRELAVKRVGLGAGSDKNAVSAAKTEIMMAKLVFPEEEDGDGGRQQGCCTERARKCLARLYNSVETSRSLCLVFEKGGACLNKILFQMKGEFFKGERIYNIRHLPLYQEFRHNPSSLKCFLLDLFHALAYLTSKGIVHGDLKPDNILVEWDESMRGREGGNGVAKVKIVDFGSAYMYAEPHTSGPATPEYMSPEANGCNSAFADRQQIEEVLVNQSRPHSVDMWSVGAIFLEILSGFPLWLAYKTRVVHGGKNHWLKGLFSASGRSTEKIIAKQQHVVQHMGEMLERYPGLWMDIDGDPAFELLQGMLDLDPARRISPVEAIDHPYFR
jgi:serine/threonine protein kinase